MINLVKIEERVMKRLILLFLFTCFSVKSQETENDTKFKFILVNKSSQLVRIFLTAAANTQQLEIEPQKELSIPKARYFIFKQFPCIEFEPTTGDVLAVTVTRERLNSLADFNPIQSDGEFWRTVKKETVRSKMYESLNQGIITFHDNAGFSYTQQQIEEAYNISLADGNSIDQQ